MKWPLKKVFVTQEWGVNGDVYKRFGYKGHNGLDLRLHEGNNTPVYAPHDGVVKERRDDPDGYGFYLKIESDKEGSILAHLKEFRVNINKQVKEGDLVAIGDNTGWSTGSHLHWGYWQQPRDRNNGYGGTIDPRPYLDQETMYYKGIDLNNHDSVKVCVDTWKDVVDGKYVGKEKYSDLLDELAEEKKALSVRIDGLKKQYQNFVRRLAELLDSTQEESKILEEITRAIGNEDKLTELKRELSIKERKVKSQADKMKELKLDLSNCQKAKVDNYTGWQLIGMGAMKLMGR